MCYISHLIFKINKQVAKRNRRVRKTKYVK